MPVLAPGTGKTRRDYLWAVARDQRGHGGRDPPIVVFHHSRSRSAKTALRLLGDYAGGGVLHVDGYRGYDALADPGRIRNPWGLAYCRVGGVVAEPLPSQTRTSRFPVPHRPVSLTGLAIYERSGPAAAGTERGSPPSVPK